MIGRTKRKHLWITFSLSFIVIVVFSQDLEALRQLVDESEYKAIEKAQEQIKTAREFALLANEKYNEALEYQTNQELDEKTLQKKLRALENKAVAFQIKADKSFSAAYKSLIKICTDKLKKINAANDGREGNDDQVQSMIIEGEAKRKEANNSKSPYEKAVLLNEAIELEAAATESLIISLQVQEQSITLLDEGNSMNQSSVPILDEIPSTGIQTNIPLQTQEYPQNNETIIPGRIEHSDEIDQSSENLIIDQNVVNKYNDYVNDPSVPQPITLTRAGASGVEDVSFDKVISAFQDNPNMEIPIEDTSEEYHVLNDTSSKDILKERNLDIQTQSQAIEKIVEVSEPVREIIDKVGESQKTLEESEFLAGKYSTPSKMHIEGELNSSSEEAGVKFFVQIAASKIPLTRSQLKAIYGGDHAIEVVRDGTWYKYQITGYKLFSDANKTAVESGVPDAWVMATYEQTEIPVPKAREMTRVLEADVLRHGRNKIKFESEYYVQVAASRIRLSSESITSICKSEVSYREIVEEGWIKYQVFAGNTYKQALMILNQIRGDAFIVPYKRGRKQYLYKSVND